MSTRVGRYTSANSMGKGQCIIDVDGFYELGTTEEGTVDGIISEVGEVISNGLIQVELKGHHEAVAYENCWVDKYGYIFSRANVKPVEPEKPEIEEPEVEEPDEPSEPQPPIVIPANPYINDWQADRYVIKLRVMGVGVALSTPDKDWLTITERGVTFDNLHINCDSPARIIIEKRDLVTILTVNNYKVAALGKPIRINQIGVDRDRLPFSGQIRDVELIDLLNPSNTTYYSMEPEIVAANSIFVEPTTIPTATPKTEPEPVPEPELKPEYRLPIEPTLVSNLQFITSGRNPWVQINQVHHDKE